MSVRSTKNSTVEGANGTGVQDFAATASSDKDTAFMVERVDSFASASVRVTPTTHVLAAGGTAAAPQDYWSLDIYQSEADPSGADGKAVTAAIASMSQFISIPLVPSTPGALKSTVATLSTSASYFAIDIKKNGTPANQAAISARVETMFYNSPQQPQGKGTTLDALTDSYDGTNAADHLRSLKTLVADKAEFSDGSTSSMKVALHSHNGSPIDYAVSSEQILSNTRLSSLIANQTNSTQKTSLLADNSGTSTVLKCDSDGHLIVNTQNTSGGGASGAATSALQTAGNASVVSIDAKLTSLITQTDDVEAKLTSILANQTNATQKVHVIGNTVANGSGNQTHLLSDSDGHLQVDIAASALPSGAGTAANQSTLIGHVDGIEGLLTTLDTVQDNALVKLTNNETLLTSINGHVDDQVGEAESTNTKLDSLIAKFPGLANSGQHLAVSLEDLGGGATQTTSAAILAKNTELESEIQSTNTKLDSLIAKLPGLANSGQHLAVSLEDLGGGATQTTTAAILAKNTELESELQTSNSKLDTLETTLTEIAPRLATGTLIAATNLADGASTNILDTGGYRNLTIFGKATSDVSLIIQYSNTNSAGAMISLYNEAQYSIQSNDVNNQKVFNTTIEHPARYIRFSNFNGEQLNALTLFYQLTN